MNQTFGRRLFLLTALEIVAVLWTLVVAAALFAFGVYVNGLKLDLESGLAHCGARLADSHATSASEAARAVLSADLRYEVAAVFVDGRGPVYLFHESREDALRVVAATVGVAPPFTQDLNVFGPAILGLAKAFGLEPVRMQQGPLGLVVRPDDAAIDDEVEPFITPFLFALLVVTGIALLVAQRLTRAVLRPLFEVQAALEQFAAGDLQPHPITPARGSSLGGLAAAYNGAIEQMERALGERERAYASMRRFIADAGHQLRTPLTVVRGFIAILRKGDLRSPDDRERILETMHRQSALMSSLVDKLMLLDRWDDETTSSAAEPIDVSRLVEDVVAPLAEANRERAVTVSAGPSELVAIDPIELSHAVTNLVDNALKYTRGAIDVAVSRAQREGSAVVQIRVADEGPGMSPDELTHAFDRFFRGSRRDVEGSGLGLSIVRLAVERAGGRIEVRSDPAGGSVFTISLPAATVPVLQGV